MTASDSDIEERELLRAAECGDGDAGQQLLARHRGRLRQMVAVYLDNRLAPRVDPSDPSLGSDLVQVNSSVQDSCNSHSRPFNRSRTFASVANQAANRRVRLGTLSARDTPSSSTSPTLATVVKLRAR